MSDDTFAIPRSLNIPRLTNRVGKAPDVSTEHHYTCWRPDISQGLVDPKDVLRFARWPASTPTGKALREWLGISAKPTNPEPNDNTKTII